MDKGTQKKSKQLGMPHRTATYRLRSALLFQLVQQAGRDKCYRCGEKIESYGEFSIEHKIPWLDSENPPGLYFDLDNVSFSHRSCNIADGRRVIAEHGTFNRYSRHGCRCEECTKANREHARKVYWRKKAKLAAIASNNVGKDELNDKVDEKANIHGD